MPFEPGQSGNPEGRPPGRPDKRTALRALLEPHAEELVKLAVDKAKAGDMTALRLCIDRLIPPVKSEPRRFALEGDTATNHARSIIKAMADGDIAADEGSTILQALGQLMKIAEVDELERRIKAWRKNRMRLESRVKKLEQSDAIAPDVTRLAFQIGVAPSVLAALARAITRINSTNHHEGN